MKVQWEWFSWQLPYKDCKIFRKDDTSWKLRFFRHLTLSNSKGTTDPVSTIMSQEYWQLADYFLVNYLEYYIVKFLLTEKLNQFFLCCRKKNYFLSPNCYKKIQFSNKWVAWVPCLIHLFPMHLFSTPWKHQKTLRFSDVFKG